MIKLYTFAVNRPDFIRYQYQTFKKFLDEEHEIIVINDGYDQPNPIFTKFENQNSGVAIDKAAADCNLKSYRVECPRRDTANDAHGRSIEFAYDKLIQYDTDISVLMDGDMFLGRPFSIRKYLEGYTFSAVAQSREHVYYMWPALLFMDMAKITDKDQLSFLPGCIDEQGVDTGGQSYKYLISHPEATVRWMKASSRITNHQGYESLPQNMIREYRDDFHFEMLCSAFVHYAVGTNWYIKDKNYHKDKTKFLFQLLDNLVHGHAHLPVFD